MRSDGIVNLVLLVGVPMTGLVLVMVVPAVLAAPERYAALAAALCGIGFVLFVAAKMSVIRRGIFVSFGSASMSSGGRGLYRAGYALMAAAVFLVLASTGSMR
jgi:hypothetical protein